MGVTMNALTPAIVVGSTVTPSASRSFGSVAIREVAALSTISLPICTRLWFETGTGISGRAMSACICGLTVSGTGSTRAGTSRVPDGADCTAA